MEDGVGAEWVSGTPEAFFQGGGVCVLFSEAMQCIQVVFQYSENVGSVGTGCGTFKRETGRRTDMTDMGA